MKLRDKILYMSFGAMLVVLGMVLNSLVSGDAEAQGDVKNAEFGFIACKGLYIKDENGRQRGYFGLSSTLENAVLNIYGDDGETIVAYLGGNTSMNGEMLFQLLSKSKTDKGQATMKVTQWGGLVGCQNNIGKSVAVLGVVSDGGGVMGTYDKFGYTR